MALRSAPDRINDLAIRIVKGLPKETSKEDIVAAHREIVAWIDEIVNIAVQKAHEHIKYMEGDE